MYFVYALYSSKSDKIYIGYSENPEKRLQSHNDERNKGWTRKFQPWKLVYTEECATKTAALKREKQLKTAAGRRFVWELIKNN
ncbi:GIY-YIG nuclease family protein [Mariniphaga sp.]|uniref:GIY-YIG nuclease family protein n=1 Tax=Mariniphaga sp. TaxID=1954475 RepID=UPI003567ADCC